MDEKFVKDQEQKVGEFDMRLAEDTINALQKEVDELVKFIAEQSIDCYEGDCRKKAIEEMGYGAYLSFLIDKDETARMTEDDWEYIKNKLNQ